MKVKQLLIATMTLASVIQAAESKPASAIDAAAAFERLKSLVGEWQAETQMGKVHNTYQLVSNGTALLETETGEKMPEMITVFYLDGDRLLLTHYCMAGNQPRMQARTFNADTGDVGFQFLDATNLANAAAGHMHNAHMRVLDNDHMDSAWEFYESGKEKFAETAHFTRVR